MPYHLAYFDLEVIATAIKLGLNMQAFEQVMHSEAEQKFIWNEITFTKAPAGSTPQQCLEQMWASRQAIRDAIAALGEDDFDRLVFIPLLGLGWVSVRVALETCYSHTWNHLMQLSFWMKCDLPLPGPAQTHRALSSTDGLVHPEPGSPKGGRARLAAAVMEFSGAGGGCLDPAYHWRYLSRQRREGGTA